MSGRAARVNHALGNSLVIEMGYFFAQNKIFQRRWAAITNF